MDAATLQVIKARVAGISKVNVRDEIMKVISVIEESRAPSILNLNAQVLEKSSESSQGSLRYDRLSKQDLMDLFKKIHNVSKGGDSLELLEQHIEELLAKQQ